MALEDERGWMKKLPAEDGVYWYRLDEQSAPDIIQVHGSDVYYTGESGATSLAHHVGGQFLGPISPSDFEQLVRLRKLATETDGVLFEVVRKHDDPMSNYGRTTYTTERARALWKKLGDKQMATIRTITDPREKLEAVINQVHFGNEGVRQEIKRLRQVLTDGVKEEMRLRADLAEMVQQKKP